MKNFRFLSSLIIMMFLLIDFSYAQFVSVSKTYQFRGKVLSFTEHSLSVRENDEEKVQIFITDDNTRIDGKISKGAEVYIIYRRKEKATRGWVKLATEITVEEASEE